MMKHLQIFIISFLFTISFGLYNSASGEVVSSKVLLLKGEVTKAFPISP